MKVTKQHEDSLFPFSFVYKGMKTPQDELPNHLHDFHEIIYVHRGSGTIFINHTLYDMHKGTIFIIPTDTIHHTIPTQGDLVTSSVIFFSPTLIQTLFIEENFSYLSLIESISKQKHYKIVLSISEQTTFEKYLNQIKTELTNKHLGFKHATIQYTQLILLYLSRLYCNETDHSLHENTASRFWMNEIFSYIDHNLTDNLSLTHLSNKAHVSPAHFSRVFKDITGISLTLYLNKKRTARAKELLWKTNDPVSQIAELSGFESTPHFYRIFKKFTGITPAKYRKNTKH
ncbi:helix-turn-helix domain-containing protein [Gracilibacillus alcaliphilus]|uniref:helix-turn-helix domain-containing protein n=1 Tax=Gracilibacillus alcaliphilus TaxID=1401441 RepID=UPI00195B9348|nr:AraC family transcriptional regulator [Gracilibacillus alcaliphilus]MBM7677187.1 YesN/AraC family two-component response regulator [Gracilibacillus alcaliphilus]